MISEKDDHSKGVQPWKTMKMETVAAMRSSVVWSSCWTRSIAGRKLRSRGVGCQEAGLVRVGEGAKASERAYMLAVMVPPMAA